MTVAPVRDNFFCSIIDINYQSELFKEYKMSQDFCLRKAKVNQKLKIKTVAAEGELGRRIRDMGLISGTEVHVIGKAPLKDPVALRLKDFTLTLRNSEADHITVTLLED